MGASNNFESWKFFASVSCIDEQNQATQSVLNGYAKLPVTILTNNAQF